MSKPVKVFEIKGDDWQKGLVTNDGYAQNGLFRQALAFDPFDKPGIYQATRLPTTNTLAGGGNITSITQVVLPGAITPNLYVSAGSKIYNISTNGFAATDITAQFALPNHRAGIIWRGKYVYMSGSDVRATSIPANSASDVLLLSGLTFTASPNPFFNLASLCVGPDLNLYVPNGDKIAKITNENGTAGNTSSILSLEKGMTVRQLLNDGRYLVILADNNTNKIFSQSKCQVIFWDMIVSSFAQEYSSQIEGEFMSGGIVYEGAVYFFVRHRLYACAAGAAPQVVRSEIDWSQVPSQIASHGNVFTWVGDKINAYGRKEAGQSFTLFSPYAKPVDTIYAATSAGNKLWLGGTNGQIYTLNSGATFAGGAASALISAPVILERPCRYEYVKVVFARPLSSGQSVSLKTTTGGGVVVSASESVSTPGKTSHLFHRNATGASSTIMEDVSLELGTTGGAEIARLSVYATPLEDTEQV